MRIARLCLVLAATLVAAPSFAADTPADNSQILMDKIKADKTLIVATNMDLSESEAKGFWPIYKRYQKDLGKLNKRLGGLIVKYADLYNNNTLTDEAAAELLDDMIAIEDDEAAMRKAYIPKLSQALSMKKVVRYLQIENKIRAMVRYEIADQVPLVE